MPYSRINAPLFGPLVLRRGTGSHSLNLLLEDAVPSLFTGNGRGTGILAAQKADYSAHSIANAARRGEVIILYGTGLGNKRPDVRITVGNAAANVLYAGPAPGFQGLDQMNITIPEAAPLGDAIGIQVVVNGRSSNIGTIAIR